MTRNTLSKDNPFFQLFWNRCHGWRLSEGCPVCETWSDADGGLHWTNWDIAVLFQFVGHGVVALPRCLYHQGSGWWQYHRCRRNVRLQLWRQSYGVVCR